MDWKVCDLTVLKLWSLGLYLLEMGAQEDSLDLVRIDTAGLEICSFSVLLSSKPDDTELTLLLKAKECCFPSHGGKLDKNIYHILSPGNSQPTAQLPEDI